VTTYIETLGESNGPYWQTTKALSKLQLTMNVTDSLKRKKLADLYDYLNRNQAYLINYQERDQQGHTYTVK